MQFLNNNNKILGYKWSQLLTITVISILMIIAANTAVFNSAEYKFSSKFNKTAKYNNELVVIEYASSDINRASIAGLVQSFVDAKAKSILLDIDLSQPDAHPLDDDILSNTLDANQSSNIILAIYNADGKIIRPLSPFSKYAKVGFVDFNLDNDILNKPINLKLNTASNTYPQAALLQLGKISSDNLSTYIDPAVAELPITTFSLNELTSKDSKNFSHKHIIIGPNSDRTKNHALLLNSLQRGELSSVPVYIVILVFLFFSLFLINLFAKNENRMKIIASSSAISVLPLIINFISIPFFRILFPSLLLFSGLALVIASLAYLNRSKLSISLKSFKIERNGSRIHLNELLEGEISVGKNGVILKADSITAKLLGFKDQNLVGTPLRKIAPSIQQEKWRAFYTNLIDLNNPNDHLYELNAKHANGGSIKLQLQLKKDTHVNSVSAQFILRNTMGKSGEVVALEYQAKQDKVSRTLNKDGIHEYLEELISNTGKNKNTIITILILRIVNLIEITSTLGQEPSEKIIKSFATNLYKNTGDSATIGRTQNSEFLVVFKHQKSVNIENQINKVIKIAKNTIHTSGISIELDLHAGIAKFPEHGKQTDDLIHAARSALLTAIDKDEKIETYKKQEKIKNNPKTNSLLEIHTALKENQFELFYQPIINMADSSVTSAEALLRWKHPDRGLIRPSEFIQQIEHSKLVRPMTKWVINTALHDARQLARYGIKLTISVNISERNLIDSHFPVLVAECINKNKMRANNIEFEISEKKLRQIPEQAIKLLTKLKKNGINFSLDNYGSENISLLNLRQLPFNKIKINRPLIEKVIKSKQDEVVIDAIIRLAHGFGMSVIAEGVESELHYNKLKQLGCDYCQGHLFSKPISITQLIKLFENWDNTMDDSQEIPAQAMATWNGQYNNN